MDCWKLALQWRHNERDGVSNHHPLDCLLNRLLVRRSKKTSRLRVTGLCAGNSPGTSNTENVSIWWRHHAPRISDCLLPYYWWEQYLVSGVIDQVKGKPERGRLCNWHVCYFLGDGFNNKNMPNIKVCIYLVHVYCNDEYSDPYTNHIMRLITAFWEQFIINNFWSIAFIEIHGLLLFR